MEDYKQRIKEHWKIIDPTFDPSTYRFQQTIYGTDAPRIKGSAWSFDRGDHYTPSEYHAKLWLFVPIFVIIFIVIFCEHFISKSRRSLTDSVPAVPPSSGSINHNIHGNSLINSSEIARIHTSPSHTRMEANRNRTESHGRNTENMIGTAPARIYLTPVGTNSQYLSLNNLRANYYARPLGFDGIDLETNSRGASHSHSMPRMGDADLLPSDKPPSYSKVVSSDLSGDPDTFPSVSLRDSTESPPPSYEQRSTYSN